MLTNFIDFKFRESNKLICKPKVLTINAPIVNCVHFT